VIEIRQFLKNGVPTILALAIAFAVGAIFMLVAEVDPLFAYSRMFFGTLGSTYYISETLVRMLPLLLGALGVALAFRAGFWNIGMEGQILLGLVGATFAGFYFTNLPPILHVMVVLIFGAAAGAFWAFIPTVLKLKLKINEILTTLLFNFIAYWIADYVIHIAWYNTKVSTPQTWSLLPSARLPALIPDTRLSVGFILAIILAVLIYILITRSTFGYKIRAVGINPKAARTVGMNISMMILAVGIISGALGGLAGAIEVSGVHYFMRVRITEYFGYISIGVATLASLNPLWIIFSSLFFGILLSGSEVMTRATGLPYIFIDVIVGVIILVVLLREFISHRHHIGKYFPIKRGR